MLKPPFVYAACLAALMLAACGGGGNSGGAGFRGEEFNVNAALAMINADAAYSMNAWGQGVTVGIIDSGITPLDEFDGRLIPGIAAQSATTNTEGIHGTNVAGIIGAARNGEGIHGAAPSVNIMPLLSGIGENGEMWTEDSFAHAAANNVQIVNNSYGLYFPHLGFEYGATATTTIRFDAPVLHPLLDAHPGLSNNIVIDTMRRVSGFAAAMEGKDMAAVWSAGNERWHAGASVRVFHISLSRTHPRGINVATVMRSPEYIVSNYVIGVPRGNNSGFVTVSMRNGVTFTANATNYTISAFSPNGIDAYGWAPRYYPTLLGRWLAVVAVDDDRRIASFSNGCGAAKAWCLAAPGVNIRVPGEGASLTTASGTSFSAAYISGALALLKSRYPQMPMSVIVQMVLQTADTLGDENIYGRGMINIDAALRAQANSQMAMANGASMPLGKVQLPNVFSAFGGRLGEVKAAVRYLDGYYYDAAVDVDIAAAPGLSPFRVVDDLRDGDINNRGMNNGDGLGFVVRRDGNDVLRFAAGKYKQLHLRHHWFGDASVWHDNNNARPFFFAAAGGRSAEVNFQLDDNFGIFAARGTEANGDYRQLGIRWQKQKGRLHLSSMLSHINEDETLLGGKFGGAMPLVNGGKTRTAKLSAKWQLFGGNGLANNKVHLFGNYQHADINADLGGLASNITGLQARGWQAGIIADGVLRGGDKLKFAFGEAMAISGGRMHLRYARAAGATIDPDTQIPVNRSWQAAEQSVDLSSPARPILSAAYGITIADSARLSFGITRPLNNKQTQAAITYRLKF